MNKKDNTLTAPAKVIQDCTFIGVNFDAKATETISLIANGLIYNAQALSKLAEVLKASNVNVECMMKVTNE